MNIVQQVASVPLSTGQSFYDETEADEMQLYKLAYHLR